MALKRSKLQQIPQRNKDLAFGYVKENEKAHKSSIPDMIKYLCLIYLNQNKDLFDAQNTHKHIKIEGNTITPSKIGSLSSYLRNIVSKGIHVWRIKCGYETNYSIGDMIGIIQNEKPLKLSTYFVTTSKSPAYGFGVAGILNQPCTIFTGARNYGCKCTVNDIVEMKVDFNELTLSFKINENDYGKAFDIKPGEYRAAITLYSYARSVGNSCYTLISYQHTY